MKNETVKTLTQVTILDGLKMLVENNGKPIEGLAMINDNCHSKWKFNQALNHCYEINGSKVFVNDLSETHNHCAKVTELDPCKAPEGYPELEPWMAYVGFTDIDPTGTPASRCSDISGSSYAFNANSCEWVKCYYNLKDHHYAVDVRTEWAQEHFPEHCRIRNYQEPSPIAKGHNPWNLTEEQVGVSDGWRLVTEDEVGLEVNKSLLQYWDSTCGWQKPACITAEVFEGCTYRTKKPEGYFLTKPDFFKEWFLENIHECYTIEGWCRKAYELGQQNPTK